MARLSNAFNIVISPAGTTPAYMSGMVANEVRALTSVANGKANYEAAAPSEWITPYPGPTLSNAGEGWPNGVFHHIQELDSYSGGIGNPVDRIVYACAGGHSASCFNGLLAFDFKGTSQPTGFFLVPGSASSPPSNAASNSPSDGRPSGTHTYDMMVYDEVNRRVWRLGFGANMVGSGDTYDWYCAADGSAGNPWTRNAAKPFNLASPGYDKTVYHRATNKVFYSCDTNSRFFNLNTRTWGATNFGVPSNEIYQMMSVYVPSDANSGTVYNFGQGTQYAYKAAINFATETHGGWQSFSVSGDNGWMSGDTCAAFWDELLNVVWVFGARGTTYPNFYRWNPATGVSTQQTMTYTVSGGGSGSVMAGNPLGSGYAYGIGKRFVYMPDWRAVGIVTSYSRPAYIWKLPSS